MSKVIGTGNGRPVEISQKANELQQIELKANEALARANAIPPSSAIIPGHVLYKRGDVIKTAGQGIRLHQSKRYMHDSLRCQKNDCNVRVSGQGRLLNRGQTISISNNHNPIDKFIIRVMDERELDDFLIRGISRRDKAKQNQPMADTTESELNMDAKKKKGAKTPTVKKPKAAAKGKTNTQRGKQNKVFGFSAGAVVAALAKAGANKAQIAAIFTAKDTKLGLPIPLSPITIRVMYDSGRGGRKRCEPAKLSPEQHSQLMALAPKDLAEGKMKPAKAANGKKVNKPKAVDKKPSREMVPTVATELDLPPSRN